MDLKNGQRRQAQKRSSRREILPTAPRAPLPHRNRSGGSRTYRRPSDRQPGILHTSATAATMVGGNPPTGERAHH